MHLIEQRFEPKPSVQRVYTYIGLRTEHNLTTFRWLQLWFFSCVCSTCHMNVARRACVWLALIADNSSELTGKTE